MKAFLLNTAQWKIVGLNVTVGSVYIHVYNVLNRLFVEKRPVSDASLDRWCGVCLHAGTRWGDLVAASVLPLPTPIFNVSQSPIFIFYQIIYPFISLWTSYRFPLFLKALSFILSLSLSLTLFKELIEEDIVTCFYLSTCLL